MGKAIHYYKNVKSLFIHYGFDAVKDHLSFHADEFDGNILSHFRVDPLPTINKNFSGSIRKLKIDFEYTFYLLKNYTKFCDI